MIDPIISNTPKNSEVTVIIVTYQSIGTISAALDALQELMDSGLVRIIVIDNASQDRTADYIEKLYPSVYLIRNINNVGFGRGCNQGIEISLTPYILLLNPDAVIDIKSLIVLVRFCNCNPKVGICGPAVIDVSGELQPAGCLPRPWRILLKPIFSKLATHGRRNVIPGEAPAKTDMICGSIMLVRRQMITEIGAFDPRFFLYFEETDLCCRAMRSGWEIWTNGEAIGRHINAASAKQTKAAIAGATISKHFYESRFYYLIKHFGWPVAIMTEIGELVSLVLGFAVGFFRGKPKTNFSARFRAPIFRLPVSPNRIDRVSVRDV
jgi:GT2 family glycosyltransferase